MATVRHRIGEVLAPAATEAGVSQAAYRLALSLVVLILVLELLLVFLGVMK